MKLPAAGIAIAVLLLPSVGAAQDISIRMEEGAFRVAGWKAPEQPPPGGWQPVFAVYAGDADVPPMLGSYAVEKGSLVFRPRFPLAAGVRARAIFHQPAGSAIEDVFEIPKPELKPSTTVLHVYPSTDVLPANQLKFYLHFSAPMRHGEAWEHIRLLDAGGTSIDLPFLEIDQELWDRDHKRLTVLFDPGRIKRGVLPLEEVGGAIEEGKQYTLVIDAHWLDDRGVPLKEEHRKIFRVSQAERTPLDPRGWRLTAPRAGSSDALVLDLPRPVDSALLLRLVAVPGVTGAAAHARNETQWRFTPAEPWKAGEYTIAIDTALEDLAGNRIGRAFDVDVFDRVTQRVTSKTVTLPFRVGGH